MKKLITICLIMAATFATQAQNKELNKEETIEYIKKLAHSISDSRIVDVTLNGKMLEKHWDSGTVDRFELKPFGEYMVVKTPNMYFNHSDHEGGYGIIESADKYKKIEHFCVFAIFNLSNEDEANRMGKALNHLMKLLQTDNSDPFGN